MLKIQYNRTSDFANESYRGFFFIVMLTKYLLMVIYSPPFYRTSKTAVM